MTVADQDPISMGNSASTTTTVMTTSIIASMTRTNIRTTRVDIRATIVEMVVEMEANLLKRTSVRLSASNAKSWGIMLMSALRRKLKDLTSQILFRKDRLTTSMWRRSMRSLMPWLVSSDSIQFRHLYSLIPVHLIHSYQKHLLKEMNYWWKPLGVL